MAVVLPIQLDQARPDPQPALPQPARPTLLVVDDEEGPRQSLQVIFKDDFHLLLASDGPSAVSLAQEHRVDVAVLDIRWPA